MAIASPILYYHSTIVTAKGRLKLNRPTLRSCDLTELSGVEGTTVNERFDSRYAKFLASLLFRLNTRNSSRILALAALNTSISKIAL